MGKLLHACVETCLPRWDAGGEGGEWRSGLEKRLAAGIVEERGRGSRGGREVGREGGTSLITFPQKLPREYKMRIILFLNFVHCDLQGVNVGLG